MKNENYKSDQNHRCFTCGGVLPFISSFMCKFYNQSRLITHGRLNNFVVVDDFCACYECIFFIVFFVVCRILKQIVIIRGVYCVR